MKVTFSMGRAVAGGDVDVVSGGDEASSSPHAAASTRRQTATNIIPRS
jgi:hypothetical protein